MKYHALFVIFFLKKLLQIIGGALWVNTRFIYFQGKCVLISNLNRRSASDNFCLNGFLIKSEIKFESIVCKYTCTMVSYRNHFVCFERSVFRTICRIFFFPGAVYLVLSALFGVTIPR